MIGKFRADRWSIRGRLVQETLRELASQLREAADDDERSGFAGIELSVKRRTVTLYWQGTLPRDIDGLVATQRVRVEAKPTRPCPAPVPPDRLTRH